MMKQYRTQRKRMNDSSQTMLLGLSIFVFVMGAADGTPLLGGRYVTTTNIQQILHLANDMEAIKQSDDATERENIYKHVSAFLCC